MAPQANMTVGWSSLMICMWACLPDSVWKVHIYILGRSWYLSVKMVFFFHNFWLKCFLLQNTATWQPSEANWGCTRGDYIPCDGIHGERQPRRIPQISWTQRHYEKGPDKLCYVSTILEATALKFCEDLNQAPLTRHPLYSDRSVCAFLVIQLDRSSNFSAELMAVFFFRY